MNIPTKALPFHAGELRAQQLAGGGPPGFAIREAMPEQHRDFFAMLRYMMVATVDHDGWPVASIVTGPSGFATSPSAEELVIARDAHWLSDIQRFLHAGKPVGMLGIDLNTRRRNRVNGTISHLDAEGVHLDVTQSFGNCPKYIQLRSIDDHAAMTATTSQAARSLTSLNAQAQAMIARADTLFAATTSNPHADENGGLDISHKGGRPGFIRADGNMLTIPDFVGNRYFNTLGNILTDPRVALLIIDFDQGHVLHLQGKGEVLWHASETAQVTGAQRLWRVHVQHASILHNAVPLRWKFVEAAPTTLATGIWQRESEVVPAK